MIQRHRSFFRALVIAVNALLVLACISLIVFGAVGAQDSLGLILLGAGVIGLIVVGAALPLAFMLLAHIGTSDRQLTPRSSERLLEQIHENTMLSDNAKRVLFRDRELDLLRRAIEEDIAHGDHNSGLTLCDDMANLFGHREEAEAYRTRILQANHAAYEAKVREALDHFERVLGARDWAQAHGHAASIKRLFPAHHLVHDIDQRILRAREEHKRELEDRFLEAANRSDVNAAMILLRQLDRYLSREEASRLAHIAQSVVMKHRENLTTQFKLAVNDHRWAEAAQVGDVIVSEYPNTKMADEVRSLIEVLRVRANQAAVVAAGK